jgi:uncharacterized protein (TIGR00369 family)
MTDNSRQRSYTWQDPMISAQVLGKTSGIDLMKAINAGELPPPPIAYTLDYRLVEVREGYAVFAGTPAEFHYNPMGVVHGGYASTLLDSALGVAVQSVMPQGFGSTTIELHVYFVRPLTRDTGRVRAIAQVLHQGKRIVTAEARLVDENDKLYSHATSTYMVLDLREGQVGK